MDEKKVVSQESIKRRGNNNQLLVREDEASEILTALNMRLAGMTFEWITGPNHNFKGLFDELMDNVKETCDLIGNRLPGGKNVTSIDKRLMVADGVMFGLELLGRAKFQSTRSKVVSFVSPEAQAEILRGTVETMVNVAALKEEG
jgi:hypothetical protein